MIKSTRPTLASDNSRNTNNIS